MENPGRFKSALIVSLIVPSVIYIVFAFAGVIFKEISGVDALVGHTRSHPEHDG